MKYIGSYIMLWVVQGNLETDLGLISLINTLKDGNYNYRLVKTIPFSNIIVDVDLDVNQYNEDNIPHLEINNNQQMVTMGSYSLALTAKEKNWTPGSFINENFEFSQWVDHWNKSNMLNGDAIEDTVANMIQRVPEGFTKLFSRPSEDTKSFTGTVFERENFLHWLNKIATSQDRFGLHADTKIIVSPAKEIQAEYRLFIVDGVVVTGSLYKVRDQVVTSEHIDENVIKFAYKMLDIWQPDRAFVLDIAVTNEGEKVIEINNINSSGFYKSDISKIVAAIDNMKF